MASGPLTVVIVAYHGDQWIPRCIESLRASLQSPVRLTLVDNVGNSCLDALALDGLECARLHCQRPLGFAEANNFALQHIDFDTEAVCFLNQDTLSGDSWLEACLQCLLANPRLGAVMPLIATYDWTAWDPAFLACARHSERFRAQFGNGQPLDACYELPEITAAAMVVRTEALFKAGPFDPIFGSYYEDYDLCRRIRELGYEVGICTQGRIAHFSGSATSSPAAERRRARQIIRNRTIHTIRAAGRSRVSAVLRYALRTFPRNLARSLCRTPSSQPLPVLLGAHWDLLRLLGRLLSQQRDSRLWNEYLATLGWPGADGKRQPAFPLSARSEADA